MGYDLAMAKKKKKTATKRMLVHDMRRILVRLPDDLAEWIDDTASAHGLSRDAFLRLQLQGIREGFMLTQVEGSDEQALFRSFENRLLEASERAVREAVTDTIRATGGVARAVGKSR